MDLLSAPKAYNILMEGGSGGHMNHPFDLDWLKNGKDLLDFFLVKIPLYFKEGNTASIKTDGVNVSFKLVTTSGPDGEERKEFAVDRGTKMAVDVEGITIDRIAEKWPNPEHGMRTAVLNLLTILNDTLEGADIEQELRTLGLWDNPDLFLNTEYVLETPERPVMNVTPYNEHFIAIHGVNEFFMKPSPKGRTMQRKSRGTDSSKEKDLALSSLVEKIRGFSDIFNIYGPKDVIAIPKGGTVDIDYGPALNTRISIKISEDNIKTDTLEGWLNNPGVKNPYDDIVVDTAGKKMLALHKDVYFALIVNNKSVSEFLGTVEPKDVGMGINAINGALIWEGIRRLGNAVLDAFYAPLGSEEARKHEGLVLQSKEVFGTSKPVKLTGDFIVSGKTGQISQLIATQDEQPATENTINKVIGIYPGRFQPMGRHHAAVYNQLLNSGFLDDVYVVTSNIAKPPKSPFNFEEKKQIAIAHGIPENKIIHVRNPYKAEELLKQFNPKTTAAVFVVGEKDQQRLKGDFFRPWEGSAEVGYEEGAYTTIAPHESIDIPGYGEMSGTSIRDALASGDMELFKQIMGSDFNKETAEMILDKLRVERVERVEIVERVVEEEIVEIIYPENRNLSSKNISYLTSLINDVIIEEKKKILLLGDDEETDEEEDEDEELEEMSAAAGGAVAGYSGPLGKKVKEDEIVESIYNYLVSNMESTR